MRTIRDATKFLLELKKDKEFADEFNTMIGGEYGWNSSNLFLHEVIQKAILRAYQRGKGEN